MTLEAWALFCLTETLLCLNPGPSTLLVLSLALTRGRAAGLLAAAGVLAANAVYFTLSGSGLVALHALSEPVYRAIQWTGAAYLIWTGARMLLRSFREPEAGIAPAAEAAPGRRSFWQGFTAQAANPNLLIYFTAILPQFVDPAHPLPGQVAILAVSSFVIEFTVLAIYSTLAARAGKSAAPRRRRGAERIAGVLLIAAGAGLAALRHS
jgi:homoserine/homoserine lactone efflux protein